MKDFNLKEFREGKNAIVVINGLEHVARFVYFDSRLEPQERLGYIIGAYNQLYTAFENGRNQNMPSMSIVGMSSEIITKYAALYSYTGTDKDAWFGKLFDSREEVMTNEVDNHLPFPAKSYLTIAKITYEI